MTTRTLIMLPISAAIGLAAGIAWVIPTGRIAEANGADETIALAWLGAIIVAIMVTAIVGPFCFLHRWHRFGPAAPAVLGLLLGWIGHASVRTDIRPGIIFGALVGIGAHYIFAFIARRLDPEPTQSRPERVGVRDAAQAVGVLLLAALIVIVGSQQQNSATARFTERAEETFALSGVGSGQEIWLPASGYQNGVCSDLRRIESADRNSADQREAAEDVSKRFEEAGFDVVRFDVPTFQAIEAHRVVRAQDGDFGVEIDLRSDETAFTIIGGECERVFGTRNGLLQEDRFTVDSFE